MKALVAYASKRGATAAIAERIAAKLVASSLEAQAIPVSQVEDVSVYDAVVIVGAAYYGSWLREATAFVHNYQAILTVRPVWLVSSGPLGTKRTDAQGRDLLTISEPKQFAEFKESIRPRGVKVFFGALDEKSLGFAGHAIRSLPGGRDLLSLGDFRDWQAIDAWTESVAKELAATPVPTGS